MSKKTSRSKEFYGMGSKRRLGIYHIRYGSRYWRTDSIDKMDVMDNEKSGLEV